jgi:hypothetical protein
VLGCLFFSGFNDWASVYILAVNEYGVSIIEQLILLLNVFSVRKLLFTCL